MIMDDDKKELYELEQWILFEENEAAVRHGAQSATWVNLSARLIALLQVMHKVIEDPAELQAALTLWRSQRTLIKDRASDRTS